MASTHARTHRVRYHQLTGEICMHQHSQATVKHTSAHENDAHAHDTSTHNIYCKQKSTRAKGAFVLRQHGAVTSACLTIPHACHCTTHFTLLRRLHMRWSWLMRKTLCLCNTANRWLKKLNSLANVANASLVIRLYLCFIDTLGQVNTLWVCSNRCTTCLILCRCSCSLVTSDLSCWIKIFLFPHCIKVAIHHQGWMGGGWGRRWKEKEGGGDWCCETKAERQEWPVAGWPVKLLVS